MWKTSELSFHPVISSGTRARPAKLRVGARERLPRWSGRPVRLCPPAAGSPLGGSLHIRCRAEVAGPPTGRWLSAQVVGHDCLATLQERSIYPFQKIVNWQHENVGKVTFHCYFVVGYHSLAQFARTCSLAMKPEPHVAPCPFKLRSHQTRPQLVARTKLTGRRDFLVLLRQPIRLENTNLWHANAGCSCLCTVRTVCGAKNIAMEKQINIMKMILI